MHAKDLLLYQSYKRKMVKKLTELFPDFVVVSLPAFVIKSIDSVDG